MSSMTLFANTAVRMTSREIAELTGKTHKNVIRDVRMMLTQLYGDGSDLSHEGIQGVTFTTDDRGYTAEIALDKDHTMTLITGYSAKMRMAIIKRWQELEQQVATGGFQIPQTMSEALRLAADLADRVAALEQQTIEMLPKAEFHDNVADAKGLYTMSEAANILQIGRNTLFSILRRLGIIKKLDQYNVPYQAYIDRGYFKVRNRFFDEHVSHATYVTPRGLTYLHRVLADYA